MTFVYKSLYALDRLLCRAGLFAFSLGVRGGTDAMGTR